MDTTTPRQILDPTWPGTYEGYLELDGPAWRDPVPRAAAVYQVGHLTWLKDDPTREGPIGYAVNVGPDSAGAMYPWWIPVDIDYELVMLPTAHNTRWLVGRIVESNMGASMPDRLWPNGPQYFCAERVAG